jgi:MtfA peptidase
MELFPVSIIRIHAFVSFVIGFVFFAIFYEITGLFSALVMSILMAFGIFLFFSEKYIKRVIRARKPFPEEWRAMLKKQVPFYSRLSDMGKRKFETDIHMFLSEQRIFAVRGQRVSDEIRLLIAASAAMLGFGMSDWEWPDLRDILVYPTGFDENYDLEESFPIRGMVHHQGPIIFSENDLKMGFLKPGGRNNVGLHEMAHVLDMANGHADGVPVGMNWMVTAPWIKVMSDRIQKIRRGECRKILKEYAGVNEAEFFAVAVEVFFQQPKALKQHDPELFQLLKSYFRIDPNNPDVTFGQK